ncbi:MAG: glycoside hydrolase family 97 catalytic domain-containing protein [Pyrinomonadaceae bacterium]|nr:glycoside hydrolase family 97 catalytic domain-containing protein [Sphingobacteriaceae bacterium]
MNLFRIGLTLLFTAAAFNSNGQQNKQWELRSPDESIRFLVTLNAETDNQTALVYEVITVKAGNKTTVIEPSPLGIDRNDQQFSRNLSFVSKSPVKSIDENYRMLIGRQSKIRNRANELELTFRNDKGSLVRIVLRAYNDGIAFKYVFPEKSTLMYTVAKELTGFKIPEKGKVWIQRYDKPGKWTPSYENYYENGIPIGTPSVNSEGWALPALFNTNGYWLLLAEANLTANYCGTRLEQNALNGLYKIRFPEPADAMGTGKVNPQYTLPWSMPWRTVIIGSSIASIVESQMINNLSDPAKGDFSWVKPGRSSWGWNTDHNSPKNYQALKEFVDLAAEMNWEYSLVDANWDLMEGGNIEQLIKYAASKSVGILMWYNSGGPHNDVSERPRDIMFDPLQRKEEFKKLRAWGVKGVKIDFWHSDKQNLIALYLDVLKDAAENHIMVNFHGCTIPRGWSRTYPNLVAMESAKGEENYDFDPTYPAQATVQNSILAFTRNVIGPMDYTPMTLTDLKYPHLTSFAHELALTLVFNSGILHFGDGVKSFRSMPAYVREFVKNVPVTFDETRFISGEPGKSFVIAARKGREWYLAGINSEKEIKNITLKLPFIGIGEYQMNLINDSVDAKVFSNKIQAFKANEPLKVKLLGFGGFVAIIKAI